MKSLSSFLLLIVLLFSFTACKQQLYKKEFSQAEKEKITEQLIEGRAFFYQGSVSEQMLFEEAKIYNPNNATVWREIGVPYLKRGFAAEYETYYHKAVQLDPLQWQGWRGYLYLYFYRDYERAIVDFDAADALTPNFVDYPQSTSIHYMRAIAYLMLNDYDRALSYLEQHITEELKTNEEKYIDPKTFLYQAIAHYKKGDFSNAIQSLETGLKHSPQNADLWFWSAKLALQIGDKEKALSSLEKAQIQLNEKENNRRPYVEEFFQIYQLDIDELKTAITFL